MAAKIQLALVVVYLAAALALKHSRRECDEGGRRQRSRREGGAAATAATPVPVEERLWDRPKRLGYQEAVKGLGGIVAPLLAGFSLATIALLVTANPPRPALSKEAIVAFAASTSMLLYSMQVGFLALERSATPSDWLDWYPEAAVSQDSLDRVRLWQAQEMMRVRALVKRYADTYELGLIFFLMGLLLLVMPRWSGGHPSGWGVAALVPVTVALLVEVWWTVVRRHNAREEERETTNVWPRPTPWPDVSGVSLRRPRSLGVAAALDPERRDAAQVDFPDLRNVDGV